ncbi:MAG: (d)CMP kinase [Prevotella sp.]|nr:(d)CMP kinase [Prevotella sp.]MCM1074808.1 (d)CMP kinase [Ruminococcus sp.]
MKKIIVAIDGFSSSGKSTMAKKLAAAVGYKYIDSGAMYRAVTLYAMRHGMIASDGSVNVAALEAELPNILIDFAANTNRTLLNGEDVESQIRSIEVASHVSPVAAIPAVRRYLTVRMQQFGAEKGIVMDGRDIGTTVFPDAEMKVFVDASAEVRAHRRFLELQAKGLPADYEEVLANVKERDRIDSTRQESPLRKADDAAVLCNDNMTLEQQQHWMLDLFNTKAE